MYQKAELYKKARNLDKAVTYFNFPTKKSRKLQKTYCLVVLKLEKKEKQRKFSSKELRI